MHQAFKFKCWEKCVASLMDLCMRGNPCFSLYTTGFYCYCWYCCRCWCLTTDYSALQDNGMAWYGIRWRATILTEISSGIRVVDCVHLFYSLSSASVAVRSLHPDSLCSFFSHFPRLCFSWDLRNGSELIFVLWCPGHRQVAMDLLCRISHYATTWMSKMLWSTSSTNIQSWTSKLS